MHPLNSPAHSPSFIPGQGAHPAANRSPQNPYAPSAPPLPLFDLNAPVPAPNYPTIANDGRVTHRPPVRTRTGDRMEAFPVASTIDAARNYIDKMNDAEAALATGHRQECLDSVLKFERSGKFSDVQKKGIQEYYSKYSIPIGMAHQLEDLVGYRFEFILDDHKDTPIEQFTAMKREICKRVELLRHIPNAGITIRTSSEFNKPLTFQVNEEHSTEVFHKIEEDLRFRQLARHTPSFLQVY